MFLRIIFFVKNPYIYNMNPYMWELTFHTRKKHKFSLHIATRYMMHVHDTCSCCVKYKMHMLTIYF